MKVCVVVLNWNRALDTLECLESSSKVYQPKGLDLDVLVVDNASTDDSVKRIKEYKAGKYDLRLLENKKNLGFAAGNNVGSKFALDNRADYVMVLNNDTFVDRDLLKFFLKGIVDYDDVGVFSPKIYFAKGYEFHKKRYKNMDLGKVIWYAGGEMDWDNVFGVNRGVDEIDKGQYDKSQVVDFATGTCMFIKCSALRRVGLFDEKYFLYFEDTDLSQRFLKHGFKLRYLPKAVVWHKVAQSSSIGSGLNDYFIARNRMYFGMKYAPYRTKFALLKQSFQIGLSGRKWEKIGIRDFYLGKFGKGSWVA